MFTVIEVCDWCKLSNPLTKHEYIDGKAHYSCLNCHDLAIMDVRLFNLDELASRKRQMHQAS